MKIRKSLLRAVACLLAVAPAAASFADGATIVDAAVWNDGDLYATVLTPTSFVAPPQHSTDTIYSFMMSGQMGQRSISEAAPGDRDYNGGRWSVEMVSFTPAGIAALTDGNGNVLEEITSDAELHELVEVGYLELHPTSIYFECPLHR